ncbi:hypothetical protein M0802_012740 [Mischocyttarus mexicanus]|nr:hypothetical protein M0802_012740 [Mischocyttarus mexicanus]
MAFLASIILAVIGAPIARKGSGGTPWHVALTHNSTITSLGSCRLLLCLFVSLKSNEASSNHHNILKSNFVL